MSSPEATFVPRPPRSGQVPRGNYYRAHKSVVWNKHYGSDGVLLFCLPSFRYGNVEYPVTVENAPDLFLTKYNPEEDTRREERGQLSCNGAILYY